MNIGSYASGMLRPPKNRSDDGMLTVLAIPNLWNYLALALSGPSIRLHSFLQRRIPSWQVRSFEATWTGANALQIDGEGRSDLLSHGRLSVTHMGRVRLLCGATR